MRKSQLTLRTVTTLAAFAALAATGTAARADDITIAHEMFTSTQTRAEVCEQVAQARAAGLVFSSEVDLSPTMTAKNGSAVSREQVRADAGKQSRDQFLKWYPA
jgi:hypothetical protein